MKEKIKKNILQSIEDLAQSGFLSKEFISDIRIDRTKDAMHGDFSTNIAMILAKPCKKSPKIIAQKIIESLPETGLFTKVEIAGPGFINFFVNLNERFEIIKEVLDKKEEFGKSDYGKGEKVLIEALSANPTGPLHVGHGRIASFGASLANILKAAGYCVSTEYYVNDAGRQMDILALSSFVRYLQLFDKDIKFPKNAYQGDYIIEIAKKAQEKINDDYVVDVKSLYLDLPLDEDEGGDKEVYIDALIAKVKKLITLKGFDFFHKESLNFVLKDIKEDLLEFGIVYDRWFSEQSLFDNKDIEKGINALKQSGLTYEKEGALWFKATEFGDEKDRVLIRANGQPTYFASDVAYHWNKYDRGYTWVIDVLGADHHGYLARLKAAVKALDHDDDALSVLFVQFVILYRHNERVQMSTRSGSFVTLRELRNEVGNDAARFFYALRKAEQHMDFDLDLAKSRSNENPVYYIQYAHARICSVLRQLEQRGFEFAIDKGISNLHLLTSEYEVNLVDAIESYPEMIEAAAKTTEPHQLAYYLKELATLLHSYYNAVTLLCEEHDLRNARLCLLQSVGIVLRNGLNLLGVSAPRSM